MNEVVEQMNAHRPAFLNELNGAVDSIDTDHEILRMRFDIDNRFCHSGNVVQGGFVTSMLDSTMTHAAFVFGGEVVNVATMEIKVSFLEPALEGKFICEGKMVKVGGSTGFMSGELFNPEGKLIATSTTTARLVRPKK